MDEDKELEKLRRKKLDEMMHKKQEELASSTVDSVVEVTDLNFINVINREGLVVIDCWTVWCAPCRMLSPIFDELAKDYAGKIVFGKLNTDDNREIALKYQIMSIPTILVFKNGNLVDRIMGAMPRRLLQPRITQHL